MIGEIIKLKFETDTRTYLSLDRYEVKLLQVLILEELLKSEN